MDTNASTGVQKVWSAEHRRSLASTMPSIDFEIGDFEIALLVCLLLLKYLRHALRWVRGHQSKSRHNNKDTNTNVRMLIETVLVPSNKLFSQDENEQNMHQSSESCGLVGSEDGPWSVKGRGFEPRHQYTRWKCCQSQAGLITIPSLVDSSEMLQIIVRPFMCQEVKKILFGLSNYPVLVDSLLERKRKSAK